jgi:hypothetical protein
MLLAVVRPLLLEEDEVVLEVVELVLKAVPVTKMLLRRNLEALPVVLLAAEEKDEEELVEVEVPPAAVVEPLTGILKPAKST